MATAVRGEGAFVDGTKVTCEAAISVAAMSGVVRDRYVPEHLLPILRANKARFAATNNGSGCAGIDYLNLLEGRSDLIFYWRTLPWDHAPGTLLATEAGCQALRLDRTSYRPGADKDGLLVASGQTATLALDTLVEAG